MKTKKYYLSQEIANGNGGYKIQITEKQFMEVVNQLNEELELRQYDESPLELDISDEDFDCYTRRELCYHDELISTSLFRLECKEGYHFTK